VVFAPTALVDTGKLATVCPAATVTVAGTLATAESLVVSETSAPSAGAGKPSHTVPVVEIPPATLFGLRTIDPRIGATVSPADFVRPSSVAEIVTVVEPVTTVVDTVKVALVAPTATVTVAGTAATAGLLLESVISSPPLGAGALRVTLAVDVVPPCTAPGFKLSPVSGEC
jgi:hypothetical protein